MAEMTDTEILDFLQETVVSTIYMDSGEVIDVGGLDVRKAIIEAMARPRCAKCYCLLVMEKQAADDSGFCSNCARDEAGK